MADIVPNPIPGALPDLGSETEASENLASLQIRVEQPQNRKCGKSRTDKGSVHLTRLGLLSRDIERAVIRSGIKIRAIRRFKKEFRDFFQPKGILAELFFESWWACYLRLHLLAKREMSMLAPGDSHQRAPVHTELREGHTPILASVTDENELENLQDIDSRFLHDSFHGLALAERYYARFSRESNQNLALLLLMREGGEAAVERFIGAGFEITKMFKEGK
jgi:hypothetical protein